MSLLMMAVSGFTFVGIDTHNDAIAATLSPMPLQTAIDAYIPFVPAFIFAYLLYYPWLLVPALVLRRREDFYRALLAFALTQVVALAVFLLFPSRMLRPDVGGLPDGLASDLIAWVYRTDRGWNVFPSLHVAHSSLVAMLCWMYCRKAFGIAALGAVLIAASTVLIKQHYVVDIPAGVLLAWISLRIATYKRRPSGQPWLERASQAPLAAARSSQAPTAPPVMRS